VTAGLCKKPEQWPWSSYRGTAGYTRRFSFVDDAPIRAYFPPGAAGQRLLRAYVEEGVTEL
jgi:hypothetical protein